MEIEEIIASRPWLPIYFVGLFIISIWSSIWKGFALWRAGRNNDLTWFITLLILNTAGILEMVYLFIISKKSDK